MSGIFDSIKNALMELTQIISSEVFPSITNGVEEVMNVVEKRIRKIEKRIIKDMITFMIISVGILFLIFATLFYLTQTLKWSYAESCFTLGMIILVIGLLIWINNERKK